MKAMRCHSEAICVSSPSPQKLGYAPPQQPRFDDAVGGKWSGPGDAYVLVGFQMAGSAITLG